jgi:hypothetical protein
MIPSHELVLRVSDEFDDIICKPARQARSSLIIKLTLLQKYFQDYLSFVFVEQGWLVCADHPYFAGWLDPIRSLLKRLVFIYRFMEISSKKGESSGSLLNASAVISSSDPRSAFTLRCTAQTFTIQRCALSFTYAPGSRL